ncbi:hypothetical protein Pcinc_011918 [Petrolisthes cinctipes]|uniref:Uncharacterized protein n=1 Tax=Petrolisthes cinctipes TaxID=88211 RepID=A0AAE1KU09_PETCI|nr:hypothetical protein Pcinc_011918 [Petrolisthes cinctipes]
MLGLPEQEHNDFIDEQSNHGSDVPDPSKTRSGRLFKPNVNPVNYINNSIPVMGFEEVVLVGDSRLRRFPECSGLRVLTMQRWTNADSDDTVCESSTWITEAVPQTLCTVRGDK